MGSVRSTVGALVAFGLASLAWFAIYLQQPLRGFSDTDDPTLGVRFARQQAEVLAAEAVAVFAMAVLLVVAALGARRVLRDRAAGIGLDAATGLGLAAVPLLFAYGALRISLIGPLEHLAGLRPAWGETAYLVVQVAGVQGLLPGALTGIALWITGLALVGLRRRAVPTVLSALGLVAALRVVAGLVAPFGIDWAVLWIAGMIAIPVTFLWPPLLGLTLALDSRRAPAKP